MKRYDILRNTAPAKLAEEISLAVDEGAVLQGNLIATLTQNKVVVYAQLVVYPD